MRKKNLFKKLIATAGAMVMALTMMMPMGVSAAPAPTIDTNEPVTLKITKYEGNDSSNRDDRVTGKEDNSVIGTVLSGVEFTALKIADIDQSTTATGTTVQYKLTQSGASVLGNGATEEEVKTGAQLNAWLKDQTASGLTTSLSSITEGKFTGTTGTDGIVYFSNDTSLSTTSKKVDITTSGQGLYLIVETDAPNTVTERSVPFIVSLPMTEKLTSGEQGQEAKTQNWQYTVYAYPKNATGEVDIDKEISLVDGTSQTTGAVVANASVGDVITYKVTYKVPVQENGLSELIVTDTMSKGLTFKNVSGIKRTTVGHTGTLVANNYTVSSEGGNGNPTTIKIDFANYLSSLEKSITESFEITYTATLNEYAVLGKTGNTNEVKLQWKNTGDTTSNVQPGNKTTVFTYGIDLTKTGENSVGLEGVQFALTDSSDKEVFVEKKTVGSNTYYVSTGEDSGSNIMTTIADGKLFIRGLEPGTYKLTEVKTNTGYVLLKAPVIVRIVQTNANDGTADGYVKSGESTETKVNMTNDTINSDSQVALVPLTVVNNKGFDLPQTGAAGTALFAIVGIVLAAVAGGLLFFLKRSPKRR